MFEEPFFDVGADDVGVIFLEEVNAGVELHYSAILQSFCERFREGRGDESAGISDKEELGVEGLRESLVRFLDDGIDVCGFSCDGKFVGEAPGGAARLGSREGKPVFPCQLFA